MRVLVEYCLSAEVEIPEEEVQKALTIKNHLAQGHRFNVLARKYDPNLWDHLDGEITGVYNPWNEVDGVIEFENPDYDEAFWES